MREEAMFVYGEAPAWIDDPFFRKGLSAERLAILKTKKREAYSKGAAETLGIAMEFGTLAPGKAADLLVLEKNPLDNVANMRTIQAVHLGGRKFE